MYSLLLISLCPILMCCSCQSFVPALSTCQSKASLPDWSDWSTPDPTTDPFENEFATLRSATETSSEPELPAYSMLTLWSDECWPEKPPAIHYDSSATSLESAKCPDSGEDASRTPTNPFLTQLKQPETAFSRALSALHSSAEETETATRTTTTATNATVEHNECDSNSNILNAYYNPFFTWSKFYADFLCPEPIQMQMKPLQAERRIHH